MVAFCFKDTLLVLQKSENPKHYLRDFGTGLRASHCNLRKGEFLSKCENNVKIIDFINEIIQNMYFVQYTSLSFFEGVGCTIFILAYFTDGKFQF